MTSVSVYYKELFAGVLTKRSDREFEFTYDQDYLRTPGRRALSVNLPLQVETFRGEFLFPFFDNLIAEGWLLGIQKRKANLRDEDRFELISEFGLECIGAVSLRRAND